MPYHPRAGPAALVLLGVVLVAVNLRIAVTALGALLAEASDAVGLSSALAGVVTMVPALVFAVAGSTTPWLMRRFRPARIVVVAMALLAGGQAVRAVTSLPAVFLVASVLALAGIAVANVLLPALVKEHFPDRVGMMTGYYMVAVILGGAVGAAAAVPVAQVTGSWRVGLGGWAVLAVVAAVPWLVPGAAGRPRPPGAAGRPRVPGAVTSDGAGRTGGAGSLLAGEMVPAPAPVAGRSGSRRYRPGRTGLGWSMAGYFGSQSLIAYALMGWLPQLFRDAGFTAEVAGLLLSAAVALGLPVALVLPAVAGRWRDLRPVVLAPALATTVALAGLAVAPGSLALLWVSLLALGQAAFPLSLALIGLRARTPEGTVALSAFAQSAGYLLAGTGPLLVGVLYGATAGWQLPLALLIAAAVANAGTGLLVARPRFLEDAR